MTAQDIYHEDLAQIHIEGYGFHWEGVADGVLEILSRHGIAGGLVVDLGCGGGQWVQRLIESGYTAWGVDASKSMIRAARRRVPNAAFLLGSMAEVPLPPCDAVTALGEPINYLDGARGVQQTLRNVYRALRPGGVFVFDALVPATGPLPPRTATRTGDTWACIAVIEEDWRRRQVVRRVTAFRQHGKHYRRSEETHVVRAYARDQMLAWLRTTGFRVRTVRAYGQYALSDRHLAYVARKP